ncbi:hypothetical protein SAMN05421747_11152 [Parapedobacter composti]|uniref:Thioredoxin domain-containing protein n=1 Tax=Parapedobacter composti TaxID=623281 RepID=A0A1I1J8F9_9SPHI|nr:ABC transporter permease [Parapedobacter composti]SFC44401.1 hypothetical protein SAMN05421747_11152 [Parapedobacter composti]
MAMVNDFLTALRAEHIKKRGTGIYMLSAAIGVLFPAVLCVFGIVRNTQFNEPFAFSYYLKYIQDAALPFTNFFFPLLIIVISSRVTQLDHRNGGWQLMDTQPLGKFALYFAKFSVVLISAVIAILSLVAGGMFFGWLLTNFIEVPGHAQLHVPWKELLQWGSRLFVACLYLAALQYMIAVLIPSFIWSILIGFGLLLTGLFAKPYGYVFDWYPFHIVSRITDFKAGSDLGYWFVYTEYVSVAAALILLYLGFQWYKHKTWRRAFLATPAKALALGVVLALGAVWLFALLRPKQGDEHPRTVLAGELDAGLPVSHVYLINPTLQDTLAIIPMQGNRFHQVLEGELVADHYQVAFDRFYQTSVYFGTRDSVYIAGVANADASKFAVRGTRLADNQAGSVKASWNRIRYYLEQNMFLDDPLHFARELHADWKKTQRESRLFKTVDNYTPKADFNKRSEKLIAVNYLSLWTGFVRKRMAVFPDQPTVPPSAIEDIQRHVSLADEALLSDESYREYVTDQFILADTVDIPLPEKALAGITGLPSGRFRDKLLYWQLSRSLKEATDSAERTALMDRFTAFFDDSVYRRRAAFVYHQWQRVGKGRPAMHFEATDLSGNRVALADLHGKLVAIDVWASWCGPCKRQSPYFERLALKYRDEAIYFIALGVDRDKSKWEIDAKGKSKSVLQWYAADMEKFGLEYNLATIPRFMLLDRAGRFIAAEMPMPSENAFELIVRKELGLPD